MFDDGSGLTEEGLVGSLRVQVTVSGFPLKKKKKNYDLINYESTLVLSYWGTMTLGRLFYFHFDFSIFRLRSLRIVTTSDKRSHV